nr:hypothetical protein GCM10025699_24190 [Microbacterium flavescens]
MLLGTHTPKLDDKGRVILPAKFRDDLGGGVVVTRGQDRCLYVFSTQEFERVHERIREAPLANKQARDFLRMFLSGASAEKPDSQNRITIPLRCAPMQAWSATSSSPAWAPMPRSGTPTRGTPTPTPTKRRTPSWSRR